MGNPSIAKKILGVMIPLADKEKVAKLTLDQTTTKLCHVIGYHLGSITQFCTYCFFIFCA